MIYLYFAYSFISDHIITDSYYYFILLCKTKRYNITWKTKTFILKIVRHIYFDDLIKLQDFDLDKNCNRQKITRKYFDL